MLLDKTSSKVRKGRWK